VVVIPSRSSTESELYRLGEYEPEVATTISDALFEGDTAIDVGAHVGHHTVSMRRAVGESGDVIALEPDSGRM